MYIQKKLWYKYVCIYRIYFFESTKYICIYTKKFNDVTNTKNICTKKFFGLPNIKSNCTYSFSVGINTNVFESILFWRHPNTFVYGKKKHQLA